MPGVAVRRCAASSSYLHVRCRGHAYSPLRCACACFVRACAVCACVLSSSCSCSRVRVAHGTHSVPCMSGADGPLGNCGVNRHRLLVSCMRVCCCVRVCVREFLLHMDAQRAMYMGQCAMQRGPSKVRFQLVPPKTHAPLLPSIHIAQCWPCLGLAAIAFLGPKGQKKRRQ